MRSARGGASGDPTAPARCWGNRAGSCSSSFSTPPARRTISNLITVRRSLREPHDPEVWPRPGAALPPAPQTSHDADALAAAQRDGCRTHAATHHGRGTYPRDNDCRSRTGGPRRSRYSPIARPWACPLLPRSLLKMCLEQKCAPLSICLPQRTTSGSTALHAAGGRQPNREAGSRPAQAAGHSPWRVALHFRNANPEAKAGVVLRLALAGRPKRY